MTKLIILCLFFIPAFHLFAQPWPRPELPDTSPLRGEKGTVWEGGFRVPCVAWGPGRIPAGRESGALIAILDILPTFAALAGAAVKTNRSIDGVDQSALLLGRSDLSACKTFYYHFTNPPKLGAVRKGTWKLVLPEGSTPFIGTSKVGYELPQTRPQLFNLAEDIGEARNLAEDKPEIVRELEALAADARRHLGDGQPAGEGLR